MPTIADQVARLETDLFMKNAALAEKDKKINTLWEAIRHGNDVHQQWLQAAIEAHFTGTIPPPRTTSSLDATELQLKIQSLENRLAISEQLRKNQANTIAEMRERFRKFLADFSYTRIVDRTSIGQELLSDQEMKPVYAYFEKAAAFVRAVRNNLSSHDDAI